MDESYETPSEYPPRIEQKVWKVWSTAQLNIIRCLITNVSGIFEGETVKVDQHGFGPIRQEVLDELLFSALSTGCCFNIYAAGWNPPFAKSENARPISEDFQIATIDILVAAGANIDNPQSVKLGHERCWESMLRSGPADRVQMKVAKHLFSKGLNVGAMYFNYEFVNRFLGCNGTADDHEWLQLLVEHSRTIPPESFESLAFLLAYALSSFRYWNFYVQEFFFKMVARLAAKEVDLCYVMQLSRFQSSAFVTDFDSGRGWERKIHQFVLNENYEKQKQIFVPILLTFVKDLSAAMTVLKLLLSHGMPTLSKATWAKMAKQGNLVTMTRVYRELICSGRYVQFPVNVEFGSHIPQFGSSALAQLGARSLAEMIRRTPSYALPNGRFLRKLEIFMGGVPSRNAVATLKDLATNFVRNRIVSRNRGLEENISTLPIPKTLAKYMTMMDLMDCLDQGILKI